MCVCVCVCVCVCAGQSSGSPIEIAEESPAEQRTVRTEGDGAPQGANIMGKAHTHTHTHTLSAYVYCLCV